MRSFSALIHVLLAASLVAILHPPADFPIICAGLIQMSSAAPPGAKT